MDWAAPAVLAAFVGAVAGAVTNLIAARISRTHELQDAHEERLRSCCAQLVEAATRVGEGHGKAHEAVRAHYVKLCLITDSSAVLYEARALVRTSWNVSEQLAGRPRLREAPPDTPAAKEIRAQVVMLLDAVRRELGTSRNLVADLEAIEQELAADPSRPTRIVRDKQSGIRTTGAGGDAVSMD